MCWKCTASVKSNMAKGAIHVIFKITVTGSKRVIKCSNCRQKISPLKPHILNSIKNLFNKAYKQMPAIIFLCDFINIPTLVVKCGKKICYAFFLCIGKTSHLLIIRTQTSDENMNIK